MLANLACNMNRLIFHEQRAAMGSVRQEIKTALTKKHNDAASRRVLYQIPQFSTDAPNRAVRLT